MAAACFRNKSIWPARETGPRLLFRDNYRAPLPKILCHRPAAHCNLPSIKRRGILRRWSPYTVIKIGFDGSIHRTPCAHQPAHLLDAHTILTHHVSHDDGLVNPRRWYLNSHLRIAHETFRNLQLALYQEEPELIFGFGHVFMLRTRNASWIISEIEGFTNFCTSFRLECSSRAPYFRSACKSI